MEQILIRNLPEGTKAALRAQAKRHGNSLEAEVRSILADTLSRQPATIVDLLSAPESAGIEFEPEKLRLTARTPQL